MKLQVAIVSKWDILSTEVDSLAVACEVIEANTGIVLYVYKSMNVCEVMLSITAHILNVT